MPFTFILLFNMAFKYFEQQRRAMQLIFTQFWVQFVEEDSLYEWIKKAWPLPVYFVACTATIILIYYVKMWDNQVAFCSNGNRTHA